MTAWLDVHHCGPRDAASIQASTAVPSRYLAGLRRAPSFRAGQSAPCGTWLAGSIAEPIRTTARSRMETQMHPPLVAPLAKAAHGSIPDHDL